MEQLSRIVARRKSLEELHGLVEALRSLAAAHAREATEALDGTRRYRSVMEGAIAETLALPGASWGGHKGNGRVLVVVGSEHGFVGGYNQRIVERALQVRQRDERLILFGQRAAMRAEENGLQVEDPFPMTTHVTGVAGSARRLCDTLGSVSQARIVFAASLPGAMSEPVVQELIPFAPPKGLATQNTPPLHHLTPTDLIERLSDELFFAQVTHALMESLASENGARLHAMEAASRNIGVRLEASRREERVVRQEEITADLIEVVSGAEAVAARASRNDN
jgi:F-type H+-transporting ATPase subunit gamma